MPRHWTVTDAYKFEGGWSAVERRPLTVEYAQELREQGYTMVVAKRGIFDKREISLRSFIASTPPTADTP